MGAPPVKPVYIVASMYTRHELGGDMPAKCMNFRAPVYMYNLPSPSPSSKRVRRVSLRKTHVRDISFRRD